MASPEQIERLNERFIMEAVPWIERRTVAINKVSDSGIPVPEGTGVLLQVADQRFVITAAHVLKLWTELALVVPIGDGTGIRLNACRAEVTRDEGDVDFALIPLAPEMVEALSPTKEFVRLSEMDVIGGEPQSGIHAVFGYPQELAKREESLVSSACFYPSNLLRPPELDPALSIAMEIHPETVDDDGDRARLPSLKCISGCGMWRLHMKGDEIDTWSVDRIRLVGIEHTVLPGKWIRGVRIRHVVGGIATRFPELERCVALLGIKMLKPTGSTASTAE